MALLPKMSGCYKDLNMIATIGTSEQACWLAEASKVLLSPNHHACIWP